MEKGSEWGEEEVRVHRTMPLPEVVTAMALRVEDHENPVALPRLGGSCRRTAKFSTG